MGFGTTTPILRIFDEAKAKEFYVGFLGFTVDWEHRFEAGLPLYMQVSKTTASSIYPSIMETVVPARQFGSKRTSSTGSKKSLSKKATSTRDRL